ncbi:hypothetical protein AEQ48_20460 [Pseudomonas libanensis]|uniref:Transposase n=1 Tax=Pseudomonas libanensis TaxID=75588 RepID=A0ABR5M469_9PSED|nr:hypothetical protein AEQ48_20460 [Pseudomonas libanensis]
MVRLTSSDWQKIFVARQSLLRSLGRSFLSSLDMDYLFDSICWQIKPCLTATLSHLLIDAPHGVSANLKPFSRAINVTRLM